MNGSDEVSVYDRLCWPEGQLELALAHGAHRRELIAYFGPAEYATLTALARQATGGARRRKQAGRMRIYLLPGLLGSQLGCRRAAGQPPDLLWLDPTDVVNGRLTALAAASGIRSLGVLPYSYLALKLRLVARGFDVVLHDYDWRGDLTVLARALVARLEADGAAQLVLIGHSMGGLLARAALARCRPDTERRITRLIGLGVPHGGSIGAVQALRATYPAVLRLAALDRVHDATALATSVFRRFVSLYQMLPAASATLDLFDRAAWPAHAPRPDPALLAAARGFGAALAPADARFISIIGTGQRTVTGIERRDGQFRYEVSAAGDGTVAAACATLSGAHDYSLRCEHSELPRSERVAEAVVELALRGRTGVLRAGTRARKGRCVYVTDAMLRQAFTRKLDWQRLSVAARRRYLNRLNAPPPLYRPSR
ncbi:MAG TPA: alpha/beta fold hydrolase [Steroidobacteraceae bacterium]|jgi:pimeloyl-ACP methyl ester carboxylesterase|nr:alpha/beta fold hydrolase [Steroidobacteraceae bacterium]